MKISNTKLQELLVGPGHVSQKDFNNALSQAVQQKKDLADILIEKDLIKDEELGQLLAEEADVPFINLKSENIAEEVLTLIPEIVARSKGVIAFQRTKEGVKIGMTDPFDLEIKNLIEKRLGEKFFLYFITKTSLTNVLSQYRASLKAEFDKILAKLQGAPLMDDEERDEITVKIVDMLVQHGHDNKASDIHIEPYKDKINIRFRIDGVLHDVLELPKDLLNSIVARIKILAKMRTDEHRAAQDGKFSFGSDLDVRVSIIPITEGENVVMRLLSVVSRQFNLTDLGLSGSDFKKVRRAMRHRLGLILATGPTGCGKTTTLYAMMKILNKREVHISTIEDPIEYDIEGVSQIQVDPKTNLTFAKGLRAIVRQDPDIIMVGEIRDEETAKIAVNSALTGHLVLTTLHTNDAATTLPRLLDMGIEPFLVASTINIAIAQRLVRKICQECRVSYELTEKEQKIIETEPEVKAICQRTGHENLSKIRLYRGVGCKSCGDTGYRGRVGIFEVLEVSEDIKTQILKRASSKEIMELAKSAGTTTMLEDGFDKVFKGITTLEEVLRVTGE